MCRARRNEHARLDGNGPEELAKWRENFSHHFASPSGPFETPTTVLTRRCNVDGVLNAYPGTPPSRSRYMRAFDSAEVGKGVSIKL